MRHRNTKSRILKYTAFVPKTLKATRNAGKNVIKRLNYFLRNSVNTIKTTTKTIDKRAAKTIRSFTKKRSRR
jgi:hypothetical protein